ncbi:hypothetical protein OS31_07590 [Dickeya oryzae]
MCTQLKGRSLFFTTPRNHDNFKTHFTGVLNGHMTKAPHPENSYSVARPSTRITQRVEGSGTGAKDRGSMYGRELGRNGYQRGMSHDNVLCIAAIATETGRQLIFTEMKKPTTAGFAVLTVPTQSSNSYPLTGLPDIGHPVPLQGNKPDDFMSRYTAGLAFLRCFSRIPEVGTAYAACFNFYKHLIRAGSGYWPLSHFQYTGGNDLHSAIFFIHKLHRKN